MGQKLPAASADCCLHLARRPTGWQLWCTGPLLMKSILNLWELQGRTEEETGQRYALGHTDGLSKPEAEADQCGAMAFLHRIAANADGGRSVRGGAQHGGASNKAEGSNKSYPGYSRKPGLSKEIRQSTV